MRNIVELIHEMYPNEELLTAEQVRQIMRQHARQVGSGRKAAQATKMSPSYWHRAAYNKQPIGALVGNGYHLEHVDMWRVVED